MPRYSAHHECLENRIRTSTQILNRRLGVRKTSKVYSRLFKRHLKRSRRRVVRYSLLTANLALLIGVVLFVLQNPNSSVNPSSALLGSETVSANPLDQLSSADIAVHVARLTAMPEAIAVANQADDEGSELSIVSADNVLVAKPQLVSTVTKSARDIKAYTSQPGDSLSSLAEKFGVTSDSIRWSNSLTGSSVPVGLVMYIPPVNGIVYTVKSGDTPDTLAQRFSASKENIIADNDAEVSGIHVGQRILIRDGKQPVSRSSYSYFSGGFSFGRSAIYGYNGYDPGYCTWYVANKRIAAGRALPANLGNAWKWDDNARRAGIPVDNNPRVGDAVVTDTSRNPGHVAYVEEVFPDGSIRISEMNARWILYNITTRVINAGTANGYNYIH